MGHVQTRQPKDRYKRKERLWSSSACCANSENSIELKEFLCIDDNKTKLFRLFAQEVGGIAVLGKDACSADGSQEDKQYNKRASRRLSAMQL